MSGNGDYTSVRGVVKINSVEDVLEKLVIRNHSDPATIARVFLIRLWVDPSNIDMSHFQFTNAPSTLSWLPRTLCNPRFLTLQLPQLVGGFIFCPQWWRGNFCRSSYTTQQFFCFRGEYVGIFTWLGLLVRKILETFVYPLLKLSTTWSGTSALLRSHGRTWEPLLLLNALTGPSLTWLGIEPSLTLRSPLSLALPLIMSPWKWLFRLISLPPKFFASKTLGIFIVVSLTWFLPPSPWPPPNDPVAALVVCLKRLRKAARA